MPPNTQTPLSPTKRQPREIHPVLKRLLEEGSVTDGNAPELIEPHEIPWIDYDLLAKGRDFVSANYAVVLLTMLMADTIGFISKQIASTVFRNFYPNNICGGRFLSTFRTTMTHWLLSDFSSGANSQFVQAIQRVRKLHKIHGRPKIQPVIPPPGLQYPPECSEIVQLLREDLKAVDTSQYPAHLITWNPDMYFTQLDVTLVQLGMFAPFLIYPEKTGLYTSYEEDEGLRGYVHMWAVIGKMLGLQDKFNLALHPDRELYRQIVDMLGTPGLKMADESVIYSIESMIQGIVNKTAPYSVTTRSLLYMGMELGGIRGDKLWESMGLVDKAAYYRNKNGIYLMRFTPVRVLTNWFAWGMLTVYCWLFLGKVSK